MEVVSYKTQTQKIGNYIQHQNAIFVKIILKDGPKEELIDLGSQKTYRTVSDIERQFRKLKNIDNRRDVSLFFNSQQKFSSNQYGKTLEEIVTPHFETLTFYAKIAW